MSRPNSNSKRSKRPSKFYVKSLKVLRRLHLYSGIALLPLVLLYGVSGILFNHPSLFNDLEIEEFDSELAEEHGLTKLPLAAELAESVVERMNGLEGGPEASKGPTYRLLEDRTMKYRRQMIVDMDEGDDIHRIVYDLDDQDGYHRIFHRNVVDESEQAPFHQKKGFRVDNGSSKIAAESARSAVESLGAEPEGKTRVRVLPAVSFHVEDAEGKVWLVTYDPQRGTLKGQDADVPLKDLGFRDYLTQLHLTHGYPSKYDGVRTIWALLVDVISGLMIFWALSGFLMWFQMKNLRFSGLIVFGISVGGLATAFYLMWQHMTTL